ncbi:ImcF-related family protein [Salipiger sp. 1_MG-2023]|uniref:ImcF-related family protein n=1 Tax=Salipiger sp. 1_MG-2023 TaxID=3062665 RepID=UPI0026E3914C|nr:ImcF-related family protein [Salipiger sp. 1_MG-2023]MDO6584927.1 ImcF-related family protein [Salipiger sp. 1_MG-2023]
MSLARAAEPVLRFIESLSAKDGERAIAAEAARMLAQFEAAAAQGGAPAVSIKPARYALAILLDQRVRAMPGLKLSTWSVIAARSLFEGRDMPPARLAEFRRTAQAEGLAELEALLADVQARLDGLRHGHRREVSGWGWYALGFALLLGLGLAGYAGALEWRYHRQIAADFRQEALLIGLDRPQEGAELTRRLDALRAAADRVAETARHAPLRRLIRLPGDSETLAEATYAEATRRQLPPALAKALEQLLANTGDGLALYDTLRAWAVLTGEAEWQPGYLAGWLEDHGLGGLARHAAPLQGPASFVPTDTVVMDQARTFAAEVPEPDRAWLELLRSDEMRALPGWVPTQAVPGLEDVLLRRSGMDLATPMPGLFTARGWEAALRTGVGLAVQTARAQAPGVTGLQLAAENRSPDLLADRLNRETLARWTAWLADLRVRPFADRETAIIVSGHLSLTDNPLGRLLSQVWVQAGGLDRSRSHAQQLLLARQLGPMIQYVEQGRMAELSRLFSGLNVALGAVDIDARRATRRLMTFQDKARSIAALKSAPRIVVQIAEDVLAGAAQPEAADASGNPLSRGWQTQVFAACRAALAGRYPFADGPDADPAALAALLGPDGLVPRFVQGSAQPLLDSSQSPWRWKPEARFAGLENDSAAFLETAMLVSQGLFAGGGLDHAITFAALAERGQTLVAIGTVAAPVRASGAPATLRWPGPDPAAGIEISFRDNANAARLTEPGPWGLLRLIDGTRLRLRDDGARALLDLRNAQGRVFLELGFAEALNPVSVRPMLSGLVCPPKL